MAKTKANLTSVTHASVDLAKNIFQVHAIDAGHRQVLTKTLKRKDFLPFMAELPPRVVGLEACATAHHWGRELQKMGHEVRLIPPAYVKPYARRQKNDAIDAAAICEALTRPHMRFVPLKSVDQQTVMMAHRSRDLLMRQRTALINAVRAHLAEIGIAAKEGAEHFMLLVDIIRDGQDRRVPMAMRATLFLLVEQIALLETSVAAIEDQLALHRRHNADCKRIASIPGVGLLTATALTAMLGDAETIKSMFGSGRDLAAYFGLVPRQNSSGGKERLGRISKMGDGYIRKLLVLGARSVLAHAKQGEQTPLKAWARKMLAIKPYAVVACALANKMARMVWAVLTKGRRYDARMGYAG